VAKLKNAMRA